MESDPLKRVDLSDMTFSEVTDELIETTYEDDRTRIYWKDKGFEADYKLKFLGSESVTVPAGTFDAYKVEVTSTDDETDKQTIWIAKDTNRVLKISANLVSLVGAKLTSELTP